MKFFPLILILALVACSSPARIEEAGSVPSNYRQQIAKDIHATFRDPYSMRDVALSDPTPWHYGLRTGWRICLRENAKNALGGYTGIQDTLYFFIQDSLIVIESNTPDCRDAHFVPSTPDFTAAP